MKSRFILIAVALSSFTAWADPSPIKFSIGKSKLRVAPPESAVAGYRSVEIPIRVTNLLVKSRWFRGLSGEPDYRIFTRNNESEPWREHSMGWCAVGMVTQRMAPGGSLTFEVSFSEEEVGRQFYVAFPVYEDLYLQSQPLEVASAPAIIR